ncbi:MAG: hypothetical protein FWD75_03390 [Propionibacteriaceae bacterium]|nr:hypothetical protein [Propionibacteriaceae bacterium]
MSRITEGYLTRHYQGVRGARDLYDLAWYSKRPFSEPLVRRLWVLKTYRDIVTGNHTTPWDAPASLAE